MKTRYDATLKFSFPPVSGLVRDPSSGPQRGGVDTHRTIGSYVPNTESDEVIIDGHLNLEGENFEGEFTLGGVSSVSGKIDYQKQTLTLTGLRPFNHRNRKVDVKEYKFKEGKHSPDGTSEYYGFVSSEGNKRNRLSGLVTLTLKEKAN